MIYIFGARSKHHLSQVDPGLRAVAELALGWGVIDFAVYESIRNKAEQNRLYGLGKTKVRWPNSTHNVAPSDAFDAAPCIKGVISWEREHCILLAGVMLAAAAALGHVIRWGGNWDMDGEPVTDQSFDDLVHYEIWRGT